MGGYEAVRDGLETGALMFDHLDAAQLVKHALGLRSEAARRGPDVRPVLVYLYAEPDGWPDGRPIPRGAIDKHRAEVRMFSERIAGNEVRFLPLDYKALLAAWKGAPDSSIGRHAEALRTHFRAQYEPGATVGSEPLWRSDN